MVSVARLLFGVHWRANEQIIEDIRALRGDVQELLQLSHRQFLYSFNRDQANIDDACPNVFSLGPAEGVLTLTGMHREISPGWPGMKMELRLYCQAPGAWHVAGDEPYHFFLAADWLKASTPYLKGLLRIFKVSADVIPGLKLDIKLSDHLAFMDSITTALAPQQESNLEVNPEKMTARGSTFRALYQVLDRVDAGHIWCGLNRVLTPEGQYLWLCDQHAGEFNFSGEGKPFSRDALEAAGER
jgi:hypothetical protein